MAGLLDSFKKLLGEAVQTGEHTLGIAPHTQPITPPHSYQPTPGITPRLDALPPSYGQQRMLGNFQIMGGFPGQLARPMLDDPRMDVMGPDYTSEAPNARQKIFNAPYGVDQAHGIPTNYNHPVFTLPNATPDPGKIIKRYSA